ncbi:BnaC06g30290D [Brassica napus]|uniref:BnaC06g30290D protein n=1 Tax=Brassica napus TaxID=3708 RepID=A0A078HLY7_BRANA|nr:BnaC06g30290D [Brassica napus]
MFFGTVVQVLLNLPECFIANCATLSAHSWINSLSIFRVKNISLKRGVLLIVVDVPRSTDCSGSRQVFFLNDTFIMILPQTPKLYACHFSVTLMFFIL